MDANRRFKSLPGEAERAARLNRAVCKQSDPRAHEVRCWPFPCGLTLTIRAHEDGETRLAIQAEDRADIEPACRSTAIGELCGRGSRDPGEAPSAVGSGWLLRIREALCAICVVR